MGAERRLTSREWEVLELLAQGCSTAQIAGKLVLSASAVRVHIASIVHKLKVTDRTAAARVFSQRSRT
jgi:DNA-binding NarL/FixJ family response regulator